MPLKRLRPTSPGVRGAVRPDFSELTRRSPHKPLTKGKHHTGGRNFRGKMTVRHRGGGAKQSWREIDFKRDKYGIPCRVESIEYDPQPLGPDRPRSLRRWGAPLHAGPSRIALAGLAHVGAYGAHPFGQRAAAPEHPDRHAGA